MTKKFQDKLADASTTAEESIGNIRTVKSFSQEKKASELYGNDIEKSYKAGSKLAFASGSQICYYTNNSILLSNVDINVSAFYPY